MQTKNLKSTALHLPQNLITDFHFWYKNVTNLHCHDCYELFIMTKGTTLHTLDDTVDKLDKNAVGIIRPGEQHKFSLYPGCKSEHICIGIQTAEFLSLCNLFDKSFVHNLLHAQAPLYFTLNEKEFEYILYLANKIQALGRESFKKQSVELTKLIVLTLISIYKEKLTQNKEIPEWLERFLDKIALPEYFCQPLKELYPLSGYSHATLNKFFQQYMGETMISYITKKKIDYACNLLQTTNFSILYISNMLSYESLAHFNRTFKKFTGTTPAAYRTTNI